MTDRKIIEGRIEAFNFMANQFEVYASDNSEIHKRYGTKGKQAVAVANKRTQTWLDAAQDCRRFAGEQRKDLEAFDKET